MYTYVIRKYKAVDKKEAEQKMPKKYNIICNNIRERRQKKEKRGRNIDVKQ